MEKEPVNYRIPLVTWHSQVRAIDRWRIKLNPVPSRNDAIRRLIDLGLDAVGESRRPDDE